MRAAVTVSAVPLAFSHMHDQLIAVLQDRMINFADMNAFRFHAASALRAEHHWILLLQSDRDCDIVLCHIDDIN